MDRLHHCSFTNVIAPPKFSVEASADQPFFFESLIGEGGVAFTTKICDQKRSGRRQDFRDVKWN
jgi:hypothetical protein